MTPIEIYSDGSSLIPRKPGGYGWLIVIEGEKVTEGNGWLRRADNNDAEVEGAYHGIIAAVQLYGVNQEFILCSDSQIVLGWVDGSYSFKCDPVNPRFSQIKDLTSNLDLRTRWIRGHSGNIFNERCDDLATLGRLKNLQSPEILNAASLHSVQLHRPLG